LIIYSILSIILGILLLNYGSDWFVLGSSKFAKSLKVSNFVIGATIVAFGTSLPEIITSVYGAFEGYGGIAAGNAIGSCITNIGFVLGICAIISPIVIKHHSILKNVKIYFMFSLIAFILGLDGYNRIDGVILFLLFLGYVIYTIKSGSGIIEEDIDESKKIGLPLSILLIILGLIAVIVGSGIFVNGAVDIAKLLGVPDSIVGFTLVAFGTSLPEFVVSLSAVRKGLGDIVLGNVVGSNIANIGAALGLSAIVLPISVKLYGAQLYINTFLVSLLLFFVIRNGFNPFKSGSCNNGISNNSNNGNNDNNENNKIKYPVISKIDGIILFIIYVVFLIITI